MLALFDELIPEDAELGELRNAISWTADLYEVGLSIAHNAYHKHSVYVLENADMPGFSRADQQLMAMLALASHQDKLTKVEPLVRSRGQWIAILCLRMAVLLLRRREDTPLPFTLRLRGTNIEVTIAREWLDNHPLTDFTLRGEVSEWRKVGFALELLER